MLTPSMFTGCYKLMCISRLCKARARPLAPLILVERDHRVLHQPFDGLAHRPEDRICRSDHYDQGVVRMDAGAYGGVCFFAGDGADLLEIGGVVVGREPENEDVEGLMQPLRRRIDVERARS